MSGWFDGSGDGTNDAFYGISAGHRGRRHHQKMRRQPMRRFGQITPDPNPSTTSMYREFVINCKLTDPFAGYWKCTATLNQGLKYKTLQITAGSSAEANNKIKDMVDQYWADNPKPDPNPPQGLPFVAAAMPNDFMAGIYTVRASYNPTTTKYVVTVFSGNISLESHTFHQTNDAGAINKFNTLTSLVTKKAKYDLEVSKSDVKGKYEVRLMVIVNKSGLVSDGSSVLSGFMKMFGLGGGHNAVVKQRMAEKQRHLALTATETPNMLPSAMQGRTHSMYTKNYNTIGSGLGESHGTNWADMPPKKFKVDVISSDGLVVKEYPETGDYAIAVEQYEEELLTIANDPGFYDPIDEPPKDPPIDGGGDLTDPTIYWINLDGTVGTGPKSKMPDGSTQISYEEYQAILDALDPGNDPPGAIVLPNYEQPVSTYTAQDIVENNYAVRASNERSTAAAMDKNNTNLLLGAAAIAGAIYLARK